MIWVFHPSTSSTPSARSDSSTQRKTKALKPQNSGQTSRSQVLKIPGAYGTPMHVASGLVSWSMAAGHLALSKSPVSTYKQSWASESFIIYKYVYDHSVFRGFGEEFFFVSASVCDSWNWNSRSNSFVRALSSGGGSNAPRPAVSVPHLDVNAGGCRARQARSCKNIACRGGILDVLVVS